MNFTFRDMVIILSMSLTVILMTFTFTALGLADESVSNDEIPEFNTTGENFDLVGQFPESPGSPSQFRMTWQENLGGDSNNQYWLDGDTTSGTELVLLNNGNSSDIRPRLAVNVWENGNVTQSKYEYTELDDYHVFNENEYELFTRYVSYSNQGNANMSFEIYVEIREQPTTDGGFLKRIPVVGGIVSTGEAVASAVFWIGSILYWTLGTMFEVILNLSASLWGVIAFFVNFMHWLMISYSAVITGASAWASVFVAIPGILLMVEFTKLILIGIKLLPTT